MTMEGEVGMTSMRKEMLVFDTILTSWDVVGVGASTRDWTGPEILETGNEGRLVRNNTLHDCDHFIDSNNIQIT